MKTTTKPPHLCTYREDGLRPIPILEVLMGLPYSGKTTYAMTAAGPQCPVVSPDAIRLAMTGERYNVMAEPVVWATAKTMVRALFIQGHRRVILDATNNTPERRGDWKAPWVLDPMSGVKYPMWLRLFTRIPISEEECIRRAKMNNDEEILPTIVRMARSHSPVTREELIFLEYSLNGFNHDSYIEESFELV